MHRATTARLRVARALLLAAAGGLSAACASSGRVAQFQDFAAAGHAYVEALDPLLAEAGDAAVDADSVALLASREEWDRERRLERLEARNELLRRRLALLGDLRAHAGALAAYFAGLASLAGDDAGTRLGTALDGPARRVASLGEALGAADVDGRRVGALVGGSAELAVAHFRARALEEELRRRAPLVARQLALERAALEIVAETIATDLELVAQRQEAERVWEPWLGDALLMERDWMDARRRALGTRAAARSAGAAIAAVESLQAAFAALVENRSTIEHLRAFTDDAGRVLDLLEVLEEP